MAFLTEIYPLPLSVATAPQWFPLVVILISEAIIVPSYVASSPRAEFPVVFIETSLAYIFELLPVANRAFEPSDEDVSLVPDIYAELFPEAASIALTA